MAGAELGRQARALREAEEDDVIRPDAAGDDAIDKLPQDIERRRQPRLVLFDRRHEAVRIPRAVRRGGREIGPRRMLEVSNELENVPRPSVAPVNHDHHAVALAEGNARRLDRLAGMNAVAQRCVTRRKPAFDLRAERLFPRRELQRLPEGGRRLRRSENPAARSPLRRARRPARGK